MPKTSKKKATAKTTRVTRLDVDETSEDVVPDVPKRPNRSVDAHPTRTPVAGNRDKLAVRGIPEGKVARWVNDLDEGSRIQMFLDAGYEFVTSKGLTIGDRTVDTSTLDTGSVRTKNVGAGVTAYLMAIDKEFYDEDQQAKYDEIQRTEESMFRDDINSEDRYGKVNIGFTS